VAKLSEAHRFEVWAQIMSDLSQYNVETPINKHEFKWLVDYLDDALETFEQNVVDGLPEVEGKSWLLANAAIAREIVVRIARARKENL